MNLLPPSAFQSVKKCADDPWKDIVRLTEEVSKLQVENTKLRETQYKGNEQRPVSPLPQNYVQQLPTEICQYSTKRDFKYIDELINKQSCEITDLKNEIRSLRCHKEEMERQLTIKEKEYGHKIISLEAELKTASDKYENQIGRLNQEHQRERDECSNVVDGLKSELTNVRIMSGQKVAELEDKYQQMKCSTDDRIDKLSLEIKSRDLTIENQSKQISQLKKYYGETKNVPISSEISKKEQDLAMVKLKVCETERESLCRSIDFLNIRVNSLNEILNLQELEMSKPPLDIDKSTSGSGLLITRWREKVFALMVQQKSTEISLKKDENNWKTKIHDLETKLLATESTAKIQIEKLTHSLSDTDARLNLEQIANMNLQREFSKIQQQALYLDKKLQETVHGAELLKEFSSSVWTKFQENCDILNRAVTSCQFYGNRINSVSGRLKLVQVQFARMEAMLTMQTEKGNIAGKVVPEGNRIEGEEGNMYLTNELERVTRERDNLAAQIKQDSVTWESKFASIRGEVQGELEAVKQTCGDLESLVQDKVKLCAELTEKLDLSQNDLTFSNQTVEDLKVTLAKQEMNLEKLLEKQKDEMENQFADRLADMDRQLSNAKCQLAKAVVSLRQLERQTAREKERSLQHFATVEEHYKHQIQSLRQQLQALEKERNLIMAILRQEGLIGKLKQERLSPITVGLEEDEMPDRNNMEEEQEPEITTVQTKLPQEAEESIANVLEDLKLLSDAMLKDNDSDMESD